MCPTLPYRLTPALVLALASCVATNPGAADAAHPPAPRVLEPPVTDHSDDGPWGVPDRPPRPLDDRGNFYVQGANGAFPRVRYLDGQLSLNDACAIRRDKKLSRRIPPVYVNGQPIGFC